MAKWVETGKETYVAFARKVKGCLPFVVGMVNVAAPFVQQSTGGTRDSRKAEVIVCECQCRAMSGVVRHSQSRVCELDPSHCELSNDAPQRRNIADARRPHDKAVALLIHRERQIPLRGRTQVCHRNGCLGSLEKRNV